MKTTQQKIKDTADQRGFSLIQFLFVVCCAMVNYFGGNGI